MVNSDAIVTLARSVIVEACEDSKIQDMLKRVVYHSLILIYVSHSVIVVKLHLE